MDGTGAGALGLRRGDVVAVAGAGGKTTLIYRLAAECRALGWRVLVTTTTHMGTLPLAITGPVLVEAEGGGAEVAAALRIHGVATLLGRRVRADKLEGIAAGRVDALARSADVVLVEADGARGRSLKTPAAHEPVVPPTTSVLVVVAALDVLGGPLDDTRVHRAERVAETAGRGVGTPVDEDVVAAALRCPAGYPSRVPPGARAGIFFNKVEAAAATAAAARLAARLCPPYAFAAAGSARGGPVWRLR